MGSGCYSRNAKVLGSAASVDGTARKSACNLRKLAAATPAARLQRVSVRSATPLRNAPVPAIPLRRRARRNATAQWNCADKRVTKWNFVTMRPQKNEPTPNGDHAGPTLPGPQSVPRHLHCALDPRPRFRLRPKAIPQKNAAATKKLGTAGRTAMLLNNPISA